MLLVDPMHVLRLRVLEKRTSHRLASVWCEADDFTPARRGQRTALCVSDMGTLQRKWRGGGTGDHVPDEGLLIHKLHTLGPVLGEKGGAPGKSHSLVPLSPLLAAT